MTDRVVLRLRHILGASGNVEQLVANATVDDFAADVVKVAALERFLEIVSEASRHIPDALKESHGSAIPWRNIAGLGNILRHAYAKSDLGILWDISHRDLPELRAAVSAMLVSLQND